MTKGNKAVFAIFNTRIDLENGIDKLKAAKANKGLIEVRLKVSNLIA